MRLIAGAVMALGGAMLLKAVVTLMGDTAWEDGFSAARETQPLEYWAFVVTWLVLGAGTVWLGISLWRPR